MDDLNFLGDVESLLNEALGFPRGTEALKVVCEKHQGTTCYIPSATEVFISWRNGRIRDRFKGDNYDELAGEFNLSASQVRRIIHEKEE